MESQTGIKADSLENSAVPSVDKTIRVAVQCHGNINFGGVQ